jgi:DNA-binding MarR family transcriptional regulator
MEKGTPLKATGSAGDDLEARKRASAGQLLLRAARLWNERAVARIAADARAAGLRVSHTALFPHLDFEGVRATALAARLGVTKQAVGKLVAGLVGMGVVEVVPDSRDGRAKLVRFSRRRGERALRHGLGVLVEIERELEARLGAGELRRLRDLLARVVDELET